MKLIPPEHLVGWAAAGNERYTGSPERRLPFVAVGMAVEFLRAFVGNEWTNQVAFGIHPQLDRKNREARTFMRAYRQDSKEGFQNQQRVVKLAEMLFHFQRVVGIESVVDDLHAGQLESTVAVLEAGEFFWLCGLNFRFVSPSGQKGRDFDVEVLLSEGKTICCEVKCKIEGRPFSAKTVGNTLSDARKQLPSDGSGLIILKVPEDWAKTRDTLAPLQSVIDDFLRSTSRVVAVLVKWEIQEIRPDGGGCAFLYMYRLFRKKEQRAEWVECALRQVQGHEGQRRWPSFMNLAGMWLQEQAQ